MINQQQVLEEYMASPFGNHALSEVIKTFEALCQDAPVYTLKKKKGRRLPDFSEYYEGWIITQCKPNTFTFFATTETEHPCSTFFPTLVSRDHCPKQNFTLPVKAWAMFYQVKLLFPEANLSYRNGRVYLNNKDYVRKLLRHWQQAFRHCDGCVMSFVLEQHYSVKELRDFYLTPKSQMDQWIAELEELANLGNRIHEPDFTLPYLARGLTGNFRSLRQRIPARATFWKMWNESRADLLAMAETYTPSVEAFKKVA